MWQLAVPNGFRTYDLQKHYTEYLSFQKQRLVKGKKTLPMDFF